MVTWTRCSFAPTRKVGVLALSMKGSDRPLSARPSHTRRRTFTGSLNAAHTDTRAGSTRLRIGPASSARSIICTSGHDVLALARSAVTDA
jgi:hypothetical protein